MTANNKKSLIVLPFFMIPLLSACGNKLDVPDRLSCGSVNAVPTVWDAGRMHFDFPNRMMTMNVREKKVCVGDRVWEEGEDRFIHIKACQIAATGRIVSERENGGYRVHAVKNLSNDAIRIELGDYDRSIDRLPIVLDCLTKPE